MKNYTTELLKVKNIAGMFYKVPARKTNKLVVYGIGAPLVPDNGTLSDAPFILDFNVDLFVPDYIGYGRSDGEFTPQNCIKTFLNLYNEFQKGCIGTSHYKNIQIPLQYEELYFIGRSFGGYYVPLLPKYNPEIKNLAIIYPVVDYIHTGDLPDEEKVTDFMKAMKLDGYKYIYRGIEKPIWKKHFLHLDGLNPLDTIKHLKNSKLFIAHGKEDKNINFTRSVNYFNGIQSAFPDIIDQFELRLYDGDHSYRTSNKAVVDYLNWMHVEK